MTHNPSPSFTAVGRRRSAVSFIFTVVCGLWSAVVICPLRFVLCALLLIFCPVRARAADWSGSVDTSFRLLDQDHLDELVSTSPANRFYFAPPAQNGFDAYAVLRPAVKLRLGFLEAGLGLDTGDISYHAIDDGQLADRAKNTYFLERAEFQAFLFHSGWLSLRGGFWPVNSASGYLVSYSLLGFEAEGDLDIPLAFPLNFWIRGNKVDPEKFFDPDQKCFLVEGGAGYALGRKGRLKVFYDYFSDPDNFFKDLLNPILERALTQRFGEAYRQLLEGFGGVIKESSDRLHYLGASVEKEIGAFSGRGILIYQFGEMDLSGEVPRLRQAPLEFSEQVPIRGELLDISLGLRPHRKIRLEGGIFWSSGDGFRKLKPEQAGAGLEINGFFSILPQITKTNLFFNGGISENLFTGAAQASGIDGHGVMAPVISASLDPLRRLSLDFTGALLLAQEGRVNGGSRYGEEFDLTLSYRPLRELSGLFEGDILFPGDFFPAGSDPVWRLSAGADYRFEF